MANLHRQVIVAIVALLFAVACRAEIDWNDSQIHWHGYVDGMAAAKKEHKNVLLVVYADWCGVCKRYSKMFFDPAVVAASKNVVLVRLNHDHDQQYLQALDEDGGYVPRTYLLNSDFKVQPSPFNFGAYKFYLPPDNSPLLIKLFQKMAESTAS